jgi:hypothetical protein
LGTENNATHNHNERIIAFHHNDKNNHYGFFSEQGRDAFLVPHHPHQRAE